MNAIDKLTESNASKGESTHETSSKTELDELFNSFSSLNRYSTRKVYKPVNFFLVAPNAREVCLVGDFNGWNPCAHPMRRQPDGTWLLQVQLNHGYHQYQFLVDGTPVLDSRAHGTANDRSGKKVSLIGVS